MGLLSRSVSISQYRVEGKLPDPVMDSLRQGLKANAIGEIDNDPSAMVSGWTCFENPFSPNFEGSRFLIDTAFVFSLRIDKKAIASKVIQKHYSLAMERRLAEEGRDFLSRAEKKGIKENVIGMLSTRIPATPSVYDLIWEYEAGYLWFFSNLKSANEELETSKEEMQSLNEELQTVNHELQARVDELSQANNDMKNLLNSTDIATLFLDEALHVRRFTPQTTSIIKLINLEVILPFLNHTLSQYFAPIVRVIH